MSHRYIPLTETDKKEMLETIGIQSIDELFADIPEKVRFDRPLDIKERRSETALLRELSALANKNKTSETHASFLGAGVYDHYMPIVVDHVISRSEFYTAYTPYQPEISQGELQAIFEFQTMIAELTGMDVANSSMYDGGTSFAEAAMLACGHTRKKKIVVSKAVNDESRAVLQTYAKDLDALKSAIDEDTACVMVQYPNFFGSIEDLEIIKSYTEGTKALFIVSSNPLALGLLTPPGEFGADIVVGDAQVFGIPAQLGGPHCGYFAATKALTRKMPGRLVGQTHDDEGQRGFVLTLQAREQHIRRDKATSNICSNQALNALAASVAMSALGKNGVVEMAEQNLYKANYMKDRMIEAGFNVLPGTSFNEFVVKFNKPVPEINAELLEEGFIGGYDLGRIDDKYEGHMLIAVTELRTKEEIDTFIEKVGAYNA